MIEIKKATNNEDIKKCCKIRKAVFGDEENAPETLYIVDDFDKARTTANYLLYVDDNPVATVRYIQKDKSTIKIQRLATLPNYRRKGYASLILKTLEADAIKFGYETIILDSAQKAAEFYVKQGYKVISDIFYEDKRPHVKMIKLLCD